MKMLSVGGKYYGHSNVRDDIFVDSQFKDDEDNPLNRSILRILATCHSVKIDENGLHGSSPEEVGILKGLKKLGYTISQKDNIITFRDEEYEVIQYLPFSFKRKWMGVIIRQRSNGKFLLDIKGACEALSIHCGELYENWESQSNDLSAAGFRILGLAEA